MSWTPRLSVFIPGTPKPGGSKRAFAHKSTGRIIVTDDCKGNADWKRNVAFFARQEFASAPLIAGPMRVTVTFIMPRLKGHFGSGRNAAVLKPSAPHFHTVKPDATKLMRSTEDACTNVLWVDDALIVEQHITKVYGDKPGAEILIEELAPNGSPVDSRGLFAGKGAL